MSKIIEEQNRKYSVLHTITGAAMAVHREYKPGLLESAYEAALKYLLEQDGMKVEQQVYLPIYWKDVQLDQSYRLDLVVNENIIVELKAVKYINLEHKIQLWNYMRITKMPYGMIINFGADSLFSEWYAFNSTTGLINRIRLMR